MTIIVFGNLNLHSLLKDKKVMINFNMRVSNHNYTFVLRHHSLFKLSYISKLLLVKLEVFMLVCILNVKPENIYRHHVVVKVL
jgi:hypothetical protein